MLFMWSREPAPTPRGSRWFAWFATAVLLWRCRRKITRIILSASPLRLLKKKPSRIMALPVATNTCSTLNCSNNNNNNHNTGVKHYHQQNQKHTLPHHHVSPKHPTGIRTKVKRLAGTGDGPHVSNANLLHSVTNINCRYIL